jgi:hypothetical protein
VAETRTLIMVVPWDQQRLKNAVNLLNEAGFAQFIKDEKHDAVDTWTRTLEAAGNDPVIVLEDDVQLTPNWREKIEAVIEEHSTQVIQFFSMRGADETVGSRLEPGRTFMMNQCYYLPAEWAHKLLLWLPSWRELNPNENGYDLAMAAFMKARGEKYWLSVPSLVQHEPWTSQIESRRPRNRQSRTFNADR